MSRLRCYCSLAQRIRRIAGAGKRCSRSCTDDRPAKCSRVVGKVACSRVLHRVRLSGPNPGGDRRCRVSDRTRSQSHRWLGRLYSKAGRPERTAALVRQEMRLSPRDPDAAASLYNICTAELQMRRYSAAISTFRKSVAENPSLAISWANLTAAYLAAGREPEARDTLSEVQKTRRAPGTGSAR